METEALSEAVEGGNVIPFRGVTKPERDVDPRVGYLKGRCRSRLCEALPELYRLVEIRGISPNEALPALKLTSHLRAFYFFKSRCEKLGVWCSREEFEAGDDGADSVRGGRIFSLTQLCEGFVSSDWSDADRPFELVVHQLGKLESFLERGFVPAFEREGVGHGRSSSGTMREEPRSRVKARWVGRVLARPGLGRGLLLLWDSGLPTAWIYRVLKAVIPDVRSRQVYALLLRLRRTRDVMERKSRSRLARNGGAEGVEAAIVGNHPPPEEPLARPIKEPLAVKGSVENLVARAQARASSKASKSERVVDKPGERTSVQPAGERLDKFFLSEEGRKFSSAAFWQGLAEESGASFEEVDVRNPMWFGSTLKVSEPGQYSKVVEELSLSVCKRLGLDTGYGFLGRLKDPEIYFNGWMAFWLHVCRSVFLTQSRREWAKEWDNYVSAATVALSPDKGWGAGLKVPPVEAFYYRCVSQRDSFQVVEEGRALLGNVMRVYAQLMNAWQSGTAWAGLSPEGGRLWRWADAVSEKKKVDMRKLFDRCAEIAASGVPVGEAASVYESAVFDVRF